MAVYLKSLPKMDTEPLFELVEARKPDVNAVLALGAKVYDKHCMECHKANGQGIPPAYPPLAGNRSLLAPSAINPIRIVLNGGFPPSTAGNPRPYGMQPFSAELNDNEIAAVVSYVRNSWGNSAGFADPEEVARFRGAPAE
jgi:mono/diheme cytochrome c family protein